MKTSTAVTEKVSYQKFGLVQSSECFSIANRLGLSRKILRFDACPFGTMRRAARTPGDTLAPESRLNIWSRRHTLNRK
jgi:hypothetical protein